MEKIDKIEEALNRQDREIVFLRTVLAALILGTLVGGGYIAYIFNSLSTFASEQKEKISTELSEIIETSKIENRKFQEIQHAELEKFSSNMSSNLFSREIDRALPAAIKETMESGIINARFSKVEIVNSENEERIVLDGESYADPVSIRDRNGNVIVRVGRNDHGGTIQTMRSNGELANQMDSNRNNNRIAVFPVERQNLKNDDYTAILYSNKDNNSYLQFIDFEGQLQASLGANATPGTGNQKPFLWLRENGKWLNIKEAAGNSEDFKEKVSNVLKSGVEHINSKSLAIENRNDNTVVRLGSQKNGGGQFLIYDKNSNLMVQSEGDEDGGKIWLDDGGDEFNIFLGYSNGNPTIKLKKGETDFSASADGSTASINAGTNKENLRAFSGNGASEVALSNDQNSVVIHSTSQDDHTHGMIRVTSGKERKLEFSVDNNSAYIFSKNNDDSPEIIWSDIK